MLWVRVPCGVVVILEAAAIRQGILLASAFALGTVEKDVVFIGSNGVV